MVRKEFVSPALVGAFVTVVAGAGAQLAFAQGHAVNPPSASARPDATPGSFADIIERVAPAVVSIEVERSAALQSTAGPSGPEADPFSELRRFFPGIPDIPQGPTGPLRAAGSGFFISPDGYIVTNNHVVEGAEKITVRTRDDRTLTATVVGRDPATDLAVVKVAGRDHPYVNFEDRARPRVGDWVVALGNPFGLGGTATAGIVSALNRPNISGSSYVDYLQIDAPINRGNSGGPTFDVYGRVVGVNSAIFSPSGGSVGIGFDIPADVAARVTRQLISSGKVVRGYIGAGVQDVTPEIAESLGVRPRSGALVAEVTPDGPSEHAGLKMGDLILGVNGQPVGSAAEVTRAVAAAHPGEPIRLEINRNGRRETLSVTSGTRPTEAALEAGDGRGATGGESGSLGLMVTPNPGGGLRIERVDPTSDAARKGLRPGDVIESVSGRPARSASDVAAALQAAHAEHRKVVLLFIARRGQHIFIPVEPKGQG
jgi:serine protease Do